MLLLEIDPKKIVKYAFKDASPIMFIVTFLSSGEKKQLHAQQ